jgi:uncharacterized protein YjbI with pentapeptide repeats
MCNPANCGEATRAMDRYHPSGRSTRLRLMRWLLRLLIALLLLVGYAFCYFIAPKIEASWKSPGPRGCDLQLMSSLKETSGIPTTGNGLIIVADVDHRLHFRIFDGHGKMVVDTDEKKLLQQAQRIEVLRKELKTLWPPQQPTRDEKVWYNTVVTSIVGYTWLETPRWVRLLTESSISFAWFTPRILLVWIGFRLVRRWYYSIKARPRRLQFRLGTVLVTIAVVAVTIAQLNAWLFAPYQAEQQAALALRRLGGKVVMVDLAPRWLRSYVGKGIFNMEVATSADLSHTRVTDSDLVHLLAFRHCLVINLSDTQLGDGGLIHLSRMKGVRWLDLSRTRVSDASVLFGFGLMGHLSSLKIAGNRIAANRIAHIEGFKWRWSPLDDLDLSDTDADDATLEELPNALVNLRNLDLSGTNVSDDGLLALLRMRGLAKLNVMDTRVTTAGVARLKSLWRYARPLTILTGTRKKAGGAPKNPPAQGRAGSAGPADPTSAQG